MRITLDALCAMCGSRKFCQRGYNSDNIFFYLMMGKMIQIHVPLKADHHRPAIVTPFKWRFAGGPMMANTECWLGSDIS